MITNFKIFEVRLGDSIIRTQTRDTSNPLYQKISTDMMYTKADFKRDTLIDRIFIHKPRKVLLFKWNHDNEHDLKNRLRDRTSFRSVSEFNEMFENIIRHIFDGHELEGGEYFKSSFRTYALHLMNTKINIIISFDYNQYIGSSPTLVIVIRSVVSLPNSNCYILDIDEDDFIETEVGVSTTEVGYS